MWIKRIFSKEKTEKQEPRATNEGNEHIETLEEEDVAASSIFLDQTPDTRYAKIKILKTTK